MKRLDAFKKIVLALAAVGLMGCNSNKSEINSQSQKVSKAETKKLSQENLTNSAEAEAKVLLKKRLELTEAEASLLSLIQDQKNLIALAEERKAGLLADAEAVAEVPDQEKLTEFSAQEALAKSILADLKMQKESLAAEERVLARQEADLRERQNLKAKDTELKKGLAQKKAAVGEDKGLDLTPVREAVKKQTSEARRKMHDMKNPLTSGSEEGISRKKGAGESGGAQ